MPTELIFLALKISNLRIFYQDLERINNPSSLVLNKLGDYINEVNSELRKLMTTEDLEIIEGIEKRHKAY